MVDVQLIGRLLEAALDPKAQSEASKELRRFGDAAAPNEQKDYALALSFHVFENPKAEVREIACIILRRRILRVWSLLSANESSQVWNNVLKRLLVEPVESVRGSLAHLCAAIGRVTFAESGNQLIQLIQEQLVQSSSAPHREAGQVILRSLMDTISEEELFASPAPGQPNYYIRMLESFARGIEDTESAKVLLAALRGIAASVERGGSPEVYAARRGLVPRLNATLKLASQNCLEAVVSGILEVFNEMSEDKNSFTEQDILLLIPVIVESVCMSQNVSVGVKDQAFRFVQSVAEHSPKHIYKNRELLFGLVRAIVHMACEPENEQQLEEDGELSQYLLACSCMDQLSVNMPSSLFLDVVLEEVTPKLKDLGNIWAQRGAVVILGVISEGCADLMRKNSQDYVNKALELLKHPSEIVRSSSSLALGQFAQYLVPDVMRGASLAIQHLLIALQEALMARRSAAASSSTDRGAVKRLEELVGRLCYALEVFVTEAESMTIKPHIDSLVCMMEDTYRLCSREDAKGSALSCLGGIASNAKGEFEPYRDRVTNLILEIFKQQTALAASGQQLLGLRAKAIELASQVVSAMRLDQQPERESMANFVYTVLQSNISESEINDKHDRVGTNAVAGAYWGTVGAEAEDDEADNELIDIRGSCFQFFTHLVAASGDAVGAMAPAVMTCAFASALANEEGTGGDHCKDTDEESSDSEMEAEGRSTFKINHSVTEQLRSALHCITAFYIHLSPKLMTPYLEKTLRVLEVFDFHFSEDIRVAIIRLAINLVLSIHRHNHPAISWWSPLMNEPSYDPEYEIWRASVSKGWTGGYPTKFLLSSSTQMVWFESVLPVMAGILMNDSSSEVISEVTHSLTMMLGILGPGALAKPTSHPSGDSGILQDEWYNLIVQSLQALFGNEHPCQEAYDVSLFDEDQEETRLREEELFEGAGQLLGAFAELLGPRLAPRVFHEFQPALLKLVHHKKSFTLRCNGLGCYADILQTLHTITKPGATADTAAAEDARELLSQYISAIVPALADCIRQNVSAILRQNSGFVVGIVSEVMPGERSFIAQLPVIWSAMKTALTEYAQQSPIQGELNAVDNIVSAIARFITSLPPTVLGPESQRPGPTAPYIAIEEAVTILCTHMPLRSDWMEAVPCAQALIRIIRDYPLEYVKRNFVLIAEGCIMLASQPQSAKVLARSPGILTELKTDLKHDFTTAIVHLFNHLASDIGLNVQPGGLQVASSSLKDHPTVKELGASRKILESTAARDYLTSIFP